MLTQLIECLLCRSCFVSENGGIRFSNARWENDPLWAMGRCDIKVVCQTVPPTQKRTVDLATYLYACIFCGDCGMACLRQRCQANLAPCTNACSPSQSQTHHDKNSLFAIWQNDWLRWSSWRCRTKIIPAPTHVFGSVIDMISNGHLRRRTFFLAMVIAFALNTIVLTACTVRWWNWRSETAWPTHPFWQFSCMFVKHVASFKNNEHTLSNWVCHTDLSHLSVHGDSGNAIFVGNNSFIWFEHFDPNDRDYDVIKKQCVLSVHVHSGNLNCMFAEMYQGVGKHNWIMESMFPDKPATSTHARSLVFRWYHVFKKNIACAYERRSDLVLRKYCQTGLPTFIDMHEIASQSTCMHRNMPNIHWVRWLRRLPTKTQSPLFFNNSMADCTWHNINTEKHVVF